MLGSHVIGKWDILILTKIPLNERNSSKKQNNRLLISVIFKYEGLITISFKLLNFVHRTMQIEF